jgi:hypothetical protein
MRPKRPSHVLIDQVRITREGSDAIINHADANVSGARIVIGPGIATMSDADIVEMYNEILDSVGALAPVGQDGRRRTTRRRSECATAHRARHLAKRGKGLLERGTDQLTLR